MDERRVRQVLVTLLDNAIAVGDVGKLTLTVKILPSTARAARLQFVISCCGNERAAAPGSALGLTFGRSLAQFMGGDIDMHPMGGRGNVVVFQVLVSVDDKRA